MLLKKQDYREFIEQQEKQMLSPYASLSSQSKGRDRAVIPCPIRTEYMRDRDRIIHSKSFRRLKHKTQVFLLPMGDHYRTRLTHTLEVSQIARTIARGLRLNEDLTEAIALGHDLGHTPFGHMGEAVLDALVPGGFEHNVQSLRVVEKLENSGKGLNLTFEVRDGILNHKISGNPATLEGAVVSLSDRIAYVNHDIDDAIRAGVITKQDIPQKLNDILGNSHGERINTMIVDVLENSLLKPQVCMSEEVGTALNELRNFMFERVYLNPLARTEEAKSKRLLEQLYMHYLEHIDEVPDEFSGNIEEDGKERIVADFIGCMTDRYAVLDYERLFVPSGMMLF
ncbi:MAG: deoxyguanosinetriphosphate triphosphohydrolase [Clostridia bacterium]|nr:deoxyguanosinetriphosphate triphosphohydrolase [Clostridia bacterium]